MRLKQPRSPNHCMEQSWPINNTFLELFCGWKINFCFVCTTQYFWMYWSQLSSLTYECPSVLERTQSWLCFWLVWPPEEIPMLSFTSDWDHCPVTCTKKGGWGLSREVQAEWEEKGLTDRNIGTVSAEVSWYNPCLQYVLCAIEVW